ncbi:MAG TPA: FkbM family methyltransferase [Chryseosolibacter sp.]|nr:FkbM family methyltransferase [Chryseosolibacter sp.]
MDHSIKKNIYNNLSVWYRPGTEDEKVLSHSFDNDIFYREIPYLKVPANPCIVDVGAHIGTFSLLTVVRFPKCQVHAFEASRETFEILNRNKLTNNLSNLIVYHQAMSGGDGIVRLFHSVAAGNWGHSITTELSASYEEVQSISLETFFTQSNIGFIDLIKFNCEGAEFEIILNTPSHILQKIGIGIILYHEDLSDRRIEELITLFRDLGFKCNHQPRRKGRGWLIVSNTALYSSLYLFYRALQRKLSRLFGNG